MRNVFFSFVALCLLAGRLCAADSLREGFANPPPEYRVHTWYHWSSNFVTPEGITAGTQPDVANPALDLRDFCGAPKSAQLCDSPTCIGCPHAANTGNQWLCRCLK